MVTGGEAKGIVRGIMDLGSGQDGFKALVGLNTRYDATNGASMLHAFLEVVSPTPLRNLGEIIPGINKWESKVGNLRSRYDDGPGDKLKQAIMVGMLPKEYQDMVMQHMVARREMRRLDKMP